jgi:hypothetical protein
LLRNPERLMVATGNIDRSKLDQQEQTHNIRLLIFENTITGKIQYGCYMSVEIADDKTPSTMHYKNVGNLTGTVLYYTMGGNLANGWTYTEGKLVDQVSAITKQQYEAQLQGNSITVKGKVMAAVYECRSGWAQKFKLTCVSAGENSPATCSWSPAGMDYVTQCAWVEQETIDHIAPPEIEGGYLTPIYLDCADIANGTATWIEDCRTCVGGTTGLTECSILLKEIKIDSTARPCVDTIATKIISEAGEIQNVLSDLLSMANLNASAAISTIANSGTYKIKIGEKTIVDETKTDGVGNSFIYRTNGSTNASSGNIDINSLMLNESTDLGVASTLIHELMHSYFVYGINHTTGYEHNVFVDMNNFLFTPTGSPQPDQATAQHTQMAVTYVNSMASILQKFAISKGIITSPNSNISLTEYCRDIFWNNLSNTQAYQAAPNKSRAEANAKREYTNASNSSKKKGC